MTPITKLKVYWHSNFRVLGMISIQQCFQKLLCQCTFFTKDHCFIDGNKRVGLDSAVVFLTVNGYEDYLEASSETKLEAYKKVIE
jgi:death-on-curing protein